ncbi:hypothetical protein OEZ86_007655 [Tetradesmus obliquus]|uniref:Uncharacterized protein n=1 Tax=Tetradesmus obliquus TaxID=3088 RepID=A0ABY8U6T2_TETOB|nr:hypothetical protein OEZ85_012862 [Tetradesmus obliquus]WIA36330.1 hypothetical protein OEZ86_007655 [Tetradesmus obliquus]
MEIGNYGLGDTGATDVLLRGNIRGFQVIAISQPKGLDACAFDSSCPVRSTISCKWSKLQTNGKRRLAVSMVAVDAGNHTSAFSVRSRAGAFDMNPDNNGIKLPYTLLAGCCFADASGQPTCKDMSQEECIARSGLAFSPGLPCARRPCEHAVVKKNAAGEGPLGTCNVRRRCFELIHQGVCRNREGVGFSNDPCRALQAAMHPACYGEPKAVPLPPFVGP